MAGEPSYRCFISTQLRKDIIGCRRRAMQSCFRDWAINLINKETFWHLFSRKSNDIGCRELRIWTTDPPWDLGGIFGTWLAAQGFCERPSVKNGTTRRFCSLYSNFCSSMNLPGVALNYKLYTLQDISKPSFHSRQSHTFKPWISWFFQLEMSFRLGQRVGKGKNDPAMTCLLLCTYFACIYACACCPSLLLLCWGWQLRDVLILLPCPHTCCFRYKYKRSWHFTGKTGRLEKSLARTSLQNSRLTIWVQVWMIRMSNNIKAENTHTHSLHLLSWLSHF